MRVQKSVYYMTDRELRIYKRQLRRRRQLQRRIVTMLATICVIAFCAVSYHGIRSLASSGEDQLKFKYYTQVTVAYGETLWDLSDDYIDYDEYKDKKEYIAEVQSINHLAEEDSIRAGQTLIVPYYSSSEYRYLPAVPAWGHPVFSMIRFCWSRKDDTRRQ